MNPHSQGSGPPDSLKSERQPETGRQQDGGLSSTPMEMSNLEQSSRPENTALDSTRIPSSSLGLLDSREASGITQQPSSGAAVEQPSTTTTTAPAEPRESVPDKRLSKTEPAVPTDAESPMATEQATAIGPSSEQPSFQEVETVGPAMMITLLLTSGARHPYKIDRKYLKKRNVNAADDDPFNLSVYTLKELIWREWREDWDLRPSSPSSIRLIHFGRLLDDKVQLKDCRFNLDSPNVVHMTVRPQEVVDEEDAKTAKQDLARDRDGNERSPGCRCVIL